MRVELRALRSFQEWAVHPDEFVRRVLKLAGRHAHQVSKYRCEVRLILESDAKSNVDNRLVPLAKQRLRSIDALLENELVGRLIRR